jgi:Zn-dependent peptidase ImmA (M78 family)
MMRVPVKPELLRWACERSRVPPPRLHHRFPKLPAWVRGDDQPTVKQLEVFANATHVPFGYLFLPEAPEEPLPLADFRERQPGPPSGDLLDTIYAAQRRQDWSREYATTERLEPVAWIGRETLQSPPATAATRLRALLDFEPKGRAQYPTWQAATKALADRMQQIGVLLSVNGVVGANTQRKLAPGEFRGFSLVDERAPLVFVNGADHPAAHAFTLCHELAHLALGQAGLSNEDLGEFRRGRVEAWCDAVASELLAPSDQVATARDDLGVERAARELTRALRVSPLIAVRRVAERSALPTATFDRCYRRAVESLPAPKPSGGGDYYAIALRRIGRRFARDVIASALEGNTTYHEAFRLLGVRNSTTLAKLSSRELSEEATIRETWMVRAEGNRGVAREVRDYAEVMRLESKRPRKGKEAP